jgi:nucleoside-diphosphate kinase
MDYTFAILKPDCTQRGLVGEVIKRLENKGLHISNIKAYYMAKESVDFLYGKYKDQPFYPGIVDFMTSGLCIVMELRGHNAVRVLRELIGADNPAPGTIRGDYAVQVPVLKVGSGMVWHNIIHASDSLEAACREMHHFFLREMTPLTY